MIDAKTAYIVAHVWLVGSMCGPVDWVRSAAMIVVGVAWYVHARRMAP